MNCLGLVDYINLSKMGLCQGHFPGNIPKIFGISLFCTSSQLLLFLFFTFLLGSEGLLSSEAVVRRCSVKKVLLKKRLRHRCFPVNFAKFLRTPISIEHLPWLVVSSDISLVVCS